MTMVRADDLAQLRQRTSAKWQVYPPDVLPLWVAEMDYPLAPVVAEAVIDVIRRSDTGYVLGPHSLGAAFAKFADSRWGWTTVEPEHVRITTDVSVAIVETFRQLIKPGAEIIITPPVYAPFFDLVPEAGGRVREIPLLDDGIGWSLDLPGIAQAFADGVKVMLLCNPHNPLGLVHSRDQLTELAKLAARYDATVVSDEIHGPLVHPDVAYTPFLDVSADARRHGICLTSASKGWNLAGFKCAMMVAASPEKLAVLDAMPEEVTFRTSQLGLHASTVAFAEGIDWLDGALATIVNSRNLLTSLLAQHLPDVSYRPPSASYLAWLDFRNTDWGSDPASRALDTYRVALNSGLTFGSEGNGFARLNFACSPEVLTEAITRLAGG